MPTGIIPKFEVLCVLHKQAEQVGVRTVCKTVIATPAIVSIQPKLFC